MKLRWFLVFAISGVGAAAAHARCIPDILFGQYDQACGGDYCYVRTPGLGTPDSIAGAFWTFNYGDPLVGLGNDDGSLPLSHWLHTEEGSPYILGRWGEGGIDGCPKDWTAPGKPAPIMVALLTDDSPSTAGLFALAAVRRVVAAFQEFDFTFAASGGHDIQLVAIPRPHVAGFQTPSTWILTGPGLADVSDGIHTDGTTTASELVTGYRVYSFQPPQVPPSHRISAGWTVASPVIPLGQDVVITAPASGTHVAYALVFDSGFETEHVGKDVHLNASLCNPTDQDDDGFNDLFGDPECCPDPDACDCNDLDASIHPGAIETCNAKDDDCDSVVDNVALPGPILALVCGKAPGTTQLFWPTQVVATSYDVLQGDLTALLDSGFTPSIAACLASDLQSNTLDHASDPAPGEGAWYLVRAKNCTGVGTYDDASLEQVTPRDPQILASPQACP